MLNCSARILLDGTSDELTNNSIHEAEGPKERQRRDHELLSLPGLSSCFISCGIRSFVKGPFRAFQAVAQGVTHRSPKLRVDEQDDFVKEEEHERGAQRSRHAQGRRVLFAELGLDHDARCTSWMDSWRHCSTRSSSCDTFSASAICNLQSAITS